MEPVVTATSAYDYDAVPFPFAERYVFLHVAVAVGTNTVATVLIIEDEAPLLILAESVLKNAGYETLTAGTLTEAEAIIRSDKKIDAVITDIILSDDREGGLHVGQLVRRTAPDTPVLYTTAAQITDGMKTLFVWPYAVLPKPYTDHQLIEGLATLLRRDSPAPPD